MKYPLEEKLPYMWLALAVLAIFYGIYFSKMLVQKRRGIRTHQIGRRKEKTLHTIEMLMGVSSVWPNGPIRRRGKKLSMPRWCMTIPKPAPLSSMRWLMRRTNLSC